MKKILLALFFALFSLTVAHADTAKLQSADGIAISSDNPLPVTIPGGITAAAGWTDGGSTIYTTTAADNVGIGTNGANAFLDISSTATQALFRINDNGTGDSTPFIVLSDGNVGIGTTIPLSTFEVVGSQAIPRGTAPTVDTAGEIAVDTTDDQLIYFGAAKRVVAYTQDKCFTQPSPTSSDDNVPIWSPVDAITITSMYCRTQGGTSAGVTISDGTNASEEIVCDSDGQADDGSIANGTYTANERMEFDMGTVTGTVDWVNYCIRYTTDAQ